MKKISKKDLSLQGETVSSLSDGAVESTKNSPKDGIGGYTKVTCKNTNVDNTCGNTCTTCPGTYTIGCGANTFATKCICVTANCVQTTPDDTCEQTKAHCPIDPPVNLSKADPDACLLTAEFCETKNICLNTNGGICETKINCETNADCEAVTISVANRCLTKPCP